MHKNRGRRYTGNFPYRNQKTYYSFGVNIPMVQYPTKGMIQPQHERLGRIPCYIESPHNIGKMRSRFYLRYFREAFKPYLHSLFFYIELGEWNETNFLKWSIISKNYPTTIFFTYISKKLLWRISTTTRPPNFKIICTLFRERRLQQTQKYDNYVYLSTERKDIPICPHTKNKINKCENCLKCLKEPVLL